MHTNRSLVTALLTTLALSFTQPGLAQVSVTIGGGLLSPQSSNLKGDIFSVYDYPLSKAGLTLGGKARLNITTLPFTLVGSLSFQSLSDDAMVTATTANGVFNVRYTSSLSILAIGVGLEYPFLSASSLRPYASLAGTMNLISGKGKHENDIIPQSTLNSTSRIGLDLGLGTVLDLPSFPVSLDIEAKFRIANLAGKHFDDRGYQFPGFGGIPQTPTYDLNDAKNPNDPRDHNRAISYLTVVLGMNVTIF